MSFAADEAAGPGRVSFVADDAAVFTSTTLDELKGMCTDLGLKPKEERDTDNDPSLSLELGNLKGALLLYHNDERITSLGLQSNFKMDVMPTLDRINEWNVAKRFSRAYLVKEKVTIEEDLDLQGGVTWKSVARFLTTFQKSVADFTKHIDYPA